MRATPWLNRRKSIARFYFQIGSTLTTASNADVTIINGSPTPYGNIYWQVGSSATLGTGTAFAGNIVALTSITLTTGLTRDTPVIVLSADAAYSQIERLLSAGAGVYLTKPLDIAEFLHTLDTYLAKDLPDASSRET